MDRLGKNINLQILSVYKKPHVSLKRRPEVVFANETGIDAGALTKEYFSVGMAALAKEALTAGDGSYPLFEGTEDPYSKPIFTAVWNVCCGGKIYSAQHFTWWSRSSRVVPCIQELRHFW